MLTVLFFAQTRELVGTIAPIFGRQRGQMGVGIAIG